MSFEQEIPLAHHEENYVHLGEASRFLKQNDDSLKEEGRVPFKNDQEHGQVDKTNGDDDADGGSINENDDSSFEHRGSSMYHHGKKRQKTVPSKMKRSWQTQTQMTTALPLKSKPWRKRPWLLNISVGVEMT